MSTTPERSELARRVLSAVEPLRRPCVLLRKTSEETGTYLGGHPPAYPGFTWPTTAGRPMAFMACINLQATHALDWLPRAGLLLFFYDMVGQPGGYDPAHRGGWEVRYVQDPSPVDGEAPGPQGLPDVLLLPRVAVAPSTVLMPPPWECAPFGGPGLPDESDMPFADEMDSLRAAVYGAAPKHQVGGYPEPVQDAPMDLECELVSRGYYLGAGYEPPWTYPEAVKQAAKEWRLLLQLDSDQELRTEWGDGGMLYFWVREADARRGVFGDTWLHLECY